MSVSVKDWPGPGVISLFGVYSYMVSFVYVPPIFFTSFYQYRQVHTALFASVEAGGSIQLWDLNTNTEVPAAICKPDKVNCLNKVTSFYNVCSDKALCISIIKVMWIFQSDTVLKQRDSNDVYVLLPNPLLSKLCLTILTRSLGPQLVRILQLATKMDRWPNFEKISFDENIFQLVVLDVSERLANPSGDASANLTHSLQEMQANKDIQVAGIKIKFLLRDGILRFR